MNIELKFADGVYYMEVETLGGRRSSQGTLDAVLERIKFYAKEYAESSLPPSLLSSQEDRRYAGGESDSDMFVDG
ncbi:MAG: hypothetical protein A2401_02140 [Candidatus Staskawiczbacteria bacterium RIFOXYC1_FULL_38_18]|uniref:Uncharacterized protein n=1 Tax=Candidatus Staskawiczbacteria bacterium RIFOXYC1_FULL_38_18 TaxID=1802229 RepID=A0A1G2JEI7_9BACT|nr:MAG: hypothetical protein A2401_02140 [Candidatus Staskawiczbacteria bacterium RIFOXYC1_FULL_38_18]